VTLLIDAQLPPALTSRLDQQGHTAQHVDYLGLLSADDIMIWNHASQSGAIIITKDEDFAERSARTRTGPAIVWLRIGNATKRVLIQWFSPRWKDIVDHIKAGDRLIEVR
jgi:predicted nuclease of predicted toxin-antitoxin system